MTTMQNAIKPASLGSVSTGTLKTSDLLSSCLHELEWQLRRNGEYFSLPENFPLRDTLNALVGEAQDCFGDDDEIPEDNLETAEEVLRDLQDALSDHFAPPYCYFGSHPGDGADVGFWPSMDSVRELPEVPDSDAAEELGEDCFSVNDHGNTTVYGGDGSVILSLV